MSKKKLMHFLILHMIIIISKVYGNDGTLDTTFGPNSNGTVVTPSSDFNSASSSQINSIALQSNGKIVAGGAANPGGTTSFALSRYNTNGTIDTTFGTEGTTTESIGTSTSFINSIAIQSDGKIIAGGISEQGGVFSFTIARFNTNGTLDSSFGTSGVTSASIGTFSEITAIAIQSDGKIVAGGQALVGGIAKFALARFNTDGSLDSSFGTGGIVTQTIGTFDGINSIAIQSDGNIIAGGSATISGTSEFTLARFQSNGAIDTSFGNNGIVTEEFGTLSSLQSIAIQSNEKIVATGIGNGTSVITRFNTNGTLDTTFANTGVFTVPLNVFATGTTSVSIFSVALQTDDKIVVGGVANPGGIDTFALVRVTTNGILDNTFGTNGVVIVSPITLFGPNGTGASIASIKIDSNGKIVTGGIFSDPTSNFALARFNVTQGCILSLNQAIIDKYGV